MITTLVALISDAYTGDDGQWVLLFNILAGQVESLLLANQLLLDDMFIQTSSSSALQRHGTEEGLSIKTGTIATGELTFTGDGGTYVPIGAESSTNPNNATLLYYTTTEDGTIPNPGVATPPTAAQGSATGLTGAYDYAVSFVTADGETLASIYSNLVNVTNFKINLTSIPLGGTGTTSRRIYRRKAGVYQGLVATIADNTTTTYTDSVADGSITSRDLPLTDTTNQITLGSEAEAVGIAYNVGVGAVTQLTDAPSGITSVTNETSFGDSNLGYTVGEDIEDIDVYRSRLLSYKQSPQTGSPRDLENWAKEVNGVDSATAFTNYNLSIPQNGHVTIRIAGPSGAVPSVDVVNLVQATLDDMVLANVIVHVATFTPVTINVTVTLTMDTGYIVADATEATQTAITNYINSLAPAATVYSAGISDAVFGNVAGVLTLVVNSPGNTTTTNTQKAVAGTITVN